MTSKLKIIFRSSTDRKEKKRKMREPLVKLSKRKRKKTKIINLKMKRRQFNTYKKIQKTRLNLKTHVSLAWKIEKKFLNG